MRKRASHSSRCYCAFCKSERPIYLQRHLSWTNVGLAAVAAALLSMLMWQGIEPKAIVPFVVFLFLSEFFIQARWRMTLSCPHCGFDPVLYLKNREAAAQKVKSFMERKRENPLAAFMEDPLMKVSRGRAQASRAQASTPIASHLASVKPPGSHISKRL